MRFAAITMTSCLLTACSTAAIQSRPIINSAASTKPYRDVAGCIVLAISKHRSFPVKTIDRADGVTISQSMPINMAQSVVTAIDVDKTTEGTSIVWRNVGEKAGQPFAPEIQACF